MFLGANMDAIAAAQEVGIDPNLAQTYTNDALGVQMNYAALDYATAHFRAQARCRRTGATPSRSGRAGNKQQNTCGMGAHPSRF